MNPVGDTSRHDSLIAPAQEARQVIETETRCWEADSKEPAFLIAMRSNLQEGTDYKIVSESTWNLLHHWYGGGPAFVRHWIDGPHPYVEVYAMQLIIKRHPSQKEENLFISRKAKKSELKTKACQLVGLKEEDVRMWDYYMGDLYANLEEQLDDGVEGPLNILNDKQAILLEEKTASGKFVLQSKTQAMSNSTPLVLRNRSFPAPPDSTYAASGRGHGLAGLSNLGNTCFMNSSIQSLAHTVPLMRKFLRHNFESDVNTDNPLGMNGKLAEAFGGLMDKLWQGDTASVSPSNFKYQLGKFAPQFQGYGQQDSQELLAFLLDGLHEDLNRIKRKPYIEEKDADGRPDKQVAAEAWENYRMRNDSSIVDHFQGLYKSTLICPLEDCQYHSIKFDPFMYLSLPLPDRRQRHFEVTAVHLDGSKSPTRYSVAVSITGKVRELYQAVAKVLHLPSEDPQKLLLLAEYDSRQTLTMHTKGSEPLSTVQITNGPGQFSSSKPLLLAYHYASPEQGPASGKQLLVYHRQRKMRSLSFMGYGGGEEFSDKFAPPLVLFMAEEHLAELPVHQVEVASAPQWKHYEYVVEPSSRVNAALESALRPFKRPRPSPDKESNGNSEDSERVVRSRLSKQSPSDDTMASIPVVPSADSDECMSKPDCLSLSKQQQTEPSSESATTDQHTNGNGDVGTGHDSHGEAIWSPEEVPVSNSHAASNGHTRSNGAHSSANGFGDGQPAASNGVNERTGDGAVQSSSDTEKEKAPLKRMSWMQDSSVAQNGTTERLSLATDGHARSQDNANGDAAALDDDGSEWEPVENGRDQDAAPANGFSTPEGKLGKKPPGLAHLGSLDSPSIIPTVQPFNMFAAQTAAQEASASGEEDAAARQAQHTEGPPYTLKCANQMGDVRLTSRPPSPEQKVLYFTAQWERDGGGVYDVSKFVQPEDDESVQRANGQTSSSNREAVQLEACLQAFQTSEELEAEDSWYCSKCKRHVQANKKLDLWTAPEVLVVHLKRFFFTRLRRDKLDVKVEFPLENWDLSAYLPPHQSVPPVYDLYAVSNHFGGMGGGHYNAYCKMPNGQWHCFDDSHVRPVDKSEIVSSSAYVLFYRRQHEAQLDPANLLEDIVPVPEDTVMSDAPAQPNDEDSSLPSAMPLIVAGSPADEDDRTTQNISETPDPAELSPADDIQDEALSSPLPMHAVPTADGAIFMMEDIPHRTSLGAAQSDVSMPSASEPEQGGVEQTLHGSADGVQKLGPGFLEAGDDVQKPGPGFLEAGQDHSDAEKDSSDWPAWLQNASNENQADTEDAASNEAEADGRSDAEDLDLDEYIDDVKKTVKHDGSVHGVGQV